MGIFKSREQRELEQKQLIKRTVYNMNKQIEALEEQKKSFAEKATRAKANGLDAQYELAITGYRLTLLQQKRAQEMLLNFEITSQLKDMALMTKQFLGGMSALSTQMSRLADGSGLRANKPSVQRGDEQGAGPGRTDGKFHAGTAAPPLRARRRAPRRTRRSSSASQRSARLRASSPTTR